MTSRESLADALESEQLAALERRTVALVERAAREGRLVVVGSAALPRKIARAARQAGTPIAAFAEYDARFWGGEAEGAAILPLDEALGRAGAEAVCLVGVWSPQHVFARTAEWLRSREVAHILPVQAAFWAWHARIGPHYQFGPASLYATHRDAILTVHDALADETSRRHYAGCVAWRVTLDPTHLPEPRADRHYFDQALLRLPADAMVADIGAFAGDTLSLFLRWHGPRFGRFMACEPDPISFAELCRMVAALPRDIAARIEPLQLALGAAPAMLRLTPTGTPGTRGEANGKVAVRCTTLDRLLGGARLDLLKVDAEGAEADVLDGAAATLARHRPSIGLAIYHAPGDVFELPLRVMRALPGHRFACRAHDHDGIDLVHYAIRPEHAA
jgi:FkbM family methyltransferase